MRLVDFSKSGDSDGIAWLLKYKIKFLEIINFSEVPSEQVRAELFKVKKKKSTPETV